MKLTIIDWQEEATCSWCEKAKECVTTNADDSFMSGAPLCWTCLRRAVKIRARKAVGSSPKTAS